MSSYGAFYSTNPKTHSTYGVPPEHPPISDSQTCPMSFAHNLMKSSLARCEHEYAPPKKSDVRSVCPALNTMANHGYIPRDGRNLTFFTIFYGLKACYGLSTPLAIVLTLGGYLLIGRLPICLPFNVPKRFAVRNPDGSTSQPGVLDLRLIDRHGGVEHDASLVHADCPSNLKYPNIEINHDWVENLVGDVLPEVRGYGRTNAACSAHIKDVKEDDASPPSLITPRLGIINHSRAPSSCSSETIVGDDDGDFDEGWRRYATKEYLNTLVSAADVGRMRARREREIAPKVMDPVHAEIARGEMAIILGVWERSVRIKDDGKVKKGIPLPYLLTWLGEERLPEGWKPDHVHGLWAVVKMSKAIKSTADAVVKARSY
ncbi:hypothetical protein E1B28_003426 [Marasmius oreades]|uniref:Heme haloperoxidase family profile domain-containing protein n=1 Tax=Marasmius oreades TaxID=181124 RepID=A0A9P7UJU8_9AGAR|nr:uncharacterized protein E1B28_003426 [Marasmius oreades]KAG7085892.1 hypothetical protein E1B28_003426 [Marasmius oreades]